MAESPTTSGNPKGPWRRRPLTITLLAMRRMFVFAGLLLLTSCHAELGTSPPTATPRWADDTQLAWMEMQRALVGRWRATTPENRTIETSYRVISNGSALVET